jgi:hypothetical protein
VKAKNPGGNPNPRTTVSAIFAAILYFGDIAALSSEAEVKEWCDNILSVIKEGIPTDYLGAFVAPTTAHLVVCCRTINGARVVRDDWAIVVAEAKKLKDRQN